MRGGPGERIERIYREVRVLAIGGGSLKLFEHCVVLTSSGSEEIMLDLASRASSL